MSGFTTTPNFGFRKPIVGADNDAWGGDWNLNADSLDALIKNTNDLLASYLPLVGGNVAGTVGARRHDLLDTSNAIISSLLPSATFAPPDLPFVFLDGASQIIGGIDTAGVLRWPTAAIGNLSLVGPLTVPALTVAGTITYSGPLTPTQITLGGQTWAPLGIPIFDLIYSYLDSAGALIGGITTAGLLRWGQIAATSLQISATPSGATDAITKGYADASYLTLAGNVTLTGPLYTAIATPTAANELASKSYVDSAAASGGGGGLAGLTAQRDYPYPPLRDPKRDYGAVGDGVADDSTAINNCIAAAQTAGERMIAINDTFNCPTLGIAAGNIVMIGNGTLKNNKVWRWPIPPFAPTPPRSVQRTLVARKHCPAFTTACRAGSAVVVQTGDSVSAPNSNGFTASAMLWTRVRRAINDQNPGVNISYYNRGIGGQRWNELDSIPTAFSTSWYTNTSRAWLLYIQDLNPDLVIINLASNDGYGFHYKYMLSVITKIRAWTKVPDIVLVTSNSGPQYQLTAGGQPTPQDNARWAMEGHTYAASFERSYALAHDIGLIDTFRFTNMHKFGWDPEDLPLVRDFSVTGTTTSRVSMALPYTWPVKCFGYGALFYIGASGWTPLGGELQFELGQQQTPNSGNVFRVGKDSTTGNIYYQIDTTTTTAGGEQTDIFVPKTVISEWPAGTGAMEFEFSVTGSSVVLKANNGLNPAVDQWVIPWLGSVPRFMAPWQPKITCTAGTVGLNNLYFDRSGDGYACALTANPHPRAMYQQTLTDSEAHGTNTTPPDIWGGGGGAHNSTLLGMLACQAAIDSCDFSTGA